MNTGKKKIEKKKADSCRATVAKRVFELKHKCCKNIALHCVYLLNECCVGNWVSYLQTRV